MSKQCHEETFLGDGYVHYLYCGDAFGGVYMFQNLSNCYFQYVQFIRYQLYLNKAVFFKKRRVGYFTNKCYQNFPKFNMYSNL